MAPTLQNKNLFDTTTTWNVDEDQPSNPYTIQTAEYTWDLCFPPAIAFHAFTKTGYPQINCKRKLIILTAATVPLLTLGFAWYVNQVSK